MDTSAIVGSSPWYRSLNREQWRVLIASNLAWLFDGFEIYALFLAIGFALHQLLDAAQYVQIPRYAGYVLATTVFGWATGVSSAVSSRIISAANARRCWRSSPIH